PLSYPGRRSQCAEKTAGRPGGDGEPRQLPARTDGDDSRARHARAGESALSGGRWTVDGERWTVKRTQPTVWGRGFAFSSHRPLSTVHRPPPGTHSTSPLPSSLHTRARTNNRSDSRFR